MKKQYLLLQLLYLLLTLSSHGQHQEIIGEKYLSVFGGSSIWNLRYTESAFTSIFGRIINVTPVYGLSFDVCLDNDFSFGCTATYQRYSFFTPNQEFIDHEGLSYFKDYELNMDRAFLGLHGNYAYWREKNFQVYSGLGAGFLFMSRNTHLIPEVDGLPTFRALHVVPKITLIGCRAFLTSHIGGLIEFSAGAPYLVQAGLCFKLNKYNDFEN